MCAAAPLGHSRIAHNHLGFCLHCGDRTGEDEALAWRVWAMQLDGPFERPHAADSEVS